MPVIVFRPWIILLISFLGTTSISALALHKFYYGTTNIVVNEKDESLDCTLQFFRDDFESMLQEKTEEKVSLNEHRTDTLLTPLVKEYVLDKFSVVQNEIELMETYIGYESNEEYVWIYIGVVQPVKGTFFVKNACLQELFEDQKNIINFKQGEEVKSQMLVGNRREGAFEMN